MVLFAVKKNFLKRLTAMKKILKIYFQLFTSLNQMNEIVLIFLLKSKLVAKLFKNNLNNIVIQIF